MKVAQEEPKVIPKVQVGAVEAIGATATKTATERAADTHVLDYYTVELFIDAAVEEYLAGLIFKSPRVVGKRIRELTPQRTFMDRAAPETLEVLVSECPSTFGGMAAAVTASDKEVHPPRLRANGGVVVAVTAGMARVLLGAARTEADIVEAAGAPAGGDHSR